MKCHGTKSISSTDKILAHIIRKDLAYFVFKNIIDKVMRKAKNYTILSTKLQVYIITTELKRVLIHIKFLEISLKYKLSIDYRC